MNFNSIHISKLAIPKLSRDETIELIQELTNEVHTKSLSEGAKHDIENLIFLCQNHLTSLSIIESNSRLNEILMSFVKAEKAATRLTHIIIVLTLLTLVATIWLENKHMNEEHHDLTELKEAISETNSQLFNLKISIENKKCEIDSQKIKLDAKHKLSRTN